MKKITTGIVSLVVTGILAGGVAHADKVARKSGIDQGSSISGQYTGKLEGEFKVGDQRVRVTRDTVIQSMSNGALAPGARVLNDSVYISGRIDSKGRLVAKMIIIRDDVSSGPGEVGEMDDNVAR